MVMSFHFGCAVGVLEQAHMAKTAEAAEAVALA
jgi:hypothetical protein